MPAVPFNVVSKKSVEEKREEARRVILDAAMDLFFEKGYEETTIRDIVKKAGILNGSLYNRFKSKEEILLSIISDAMGDFLAESERIFSEEKDPVVAFTLPAAIELYLASSSPRIAEMVYDAHRSWTAVDEYIAMYSDWSKKVLSPLHHFIFDDESIRMKVIAVIGAIGNICGCYANGYGQDYRTVLSYLIKIVSTVLEQPVFDIAGIVDKLATVVESGDIVICGYRLSDICPRPSSDKD